MDRSGLELLLQRKFSVATEEDVRKVAAALQTDRPWCNAEGLSVQTGVRIEAVAEVLSAVLALGLEQPIGPVPIRGTRSWALAIWAVVLVAIGYTGSQVIKTVGADRKQVRVHLSREALNQRIAGAIARTKHDRVIYEDILGEGPGAWDPSPRYPSGIVNCLLWVDEVLSEAYGEEADEAGKTEIMDRIRYFQGQVAFGLRKHFLPQALSLEPAPLQAIPLSKFSSRLLHENVTHDYQRFLQIHQYHCALFQKEKASFDLEYVGPDDAIQVAGALPSGFYFLFGVETAQYQKMYGATSGPMGLVHGLILELTGNPGSRHPGEMTVHHASITSKKVMSEAWPEYVGKMRQKLHRGYVFYEADPAWDYTALPLETSETIAIQKCEKDLRSQGGRRAVGLR